MTVSSLSVEAHSVGQESAKLDSLSRPATWLFVVPTLIGFVRPPDALDVYLRTGYVAVAVLPVLIGTALIAGIAPPRRSGLVVAAAMTCVVLSLGYAFAWPWMAAGSINAPSLKLGLIAMLYCFNAAAFAALFYDEQRLLDTFWRVTIAATIAALVAYMVNAVTGDGWLVHRQYGTPRVQGFMSEPSGWAPIAPALLLMSLERRRYSVTALAVAAVVLTKSPTVTLAAVTSLTAYFLLSPRWRRWRKEMILGLTVAWYFIMRWFQTIPTDGPVGTGWFDQVAVRLASGVTNVASNGEAGRNDRFASTQAVFDELHQHGWLLTGIGPGAEQYIRLQTGGLLPNSLPVFVFAAFGLIGVALLGMALLYAVARYRRSSGFALFVPFVVAALINSAGGWESYKFVVVAVVAAALAARRPRTTAWPPLPANRPAMPPQSSWAGPSGRSVGRRQVETGEQTN